MISWNTCKISWLDIASVAVVSALFFRCCFEMYVSPFCVYTLQSITITVNVYVVFQNYTIAEDGGCIFS